MYTFIENQRFDVSHTHTTHELKCSVALAAVLTRLVCNDIMIIKIMIKDKNSHIKTLVFCLFLGSAENTRLFCMLSVVVYSVSMVLPCLHLSTVVYSTV